MDPIEPIQEVFNLDRTLYSPAHIASLAFGHAGHLFAGSGQWHIYAIISRLYIRHESYKREI